MPQARSPSRSRSRTGDAAVAADDGVPTSTPTAKKSTTTKSTTTPTKTTKTPTKTTKTTTAPTAKKPTTTTAAKKKGATGTTTSRNAKATTTSTTTTTTTTTALPSRHDLHLLRKAFHMSWGVGFALAYEHFVTRTQLSAFLGGYWLLLCVFETARAYVPAVNRLCVAAWGNVIRAHEVKQMSGMFYYMYGCAVAVYLWPRRVAILALTALAVGDPVASAVGIVCGARARRANGKSVLGFAAATLACAACALAWLHHWSAAPLSALVWPALLCGVAGPVIEVNVPTPRRSVLDDNWLIPIGSAVLIAGVFQRYLPDMPVD